MKHVPTLSGLILAGGKSLRMGHDKALIEYHNVSQREYLFNLLRSFCASVFTSCKNTHDVPGQFNPLPDKYDFDSPLNGILTAFSHGAISSWLTVPIDMPLIDAEMISYLLNKRNTAKVATCFYDSDGKNPEPLITIWEPQAYPLLLAFQNLGQISPRDFLKQHDTHIIQIPDRNSLANINSPEDLERFKMSKQRK